MLAHVFLVIHFIDACQRIEAEAPVAVTVMTAMHSVRKATALSFNFDATMRHC